MTASSVVRSKFIAPFTVFTRFGIRSCRRLSCTSICFQALATWFLSAIRPVVGTDHPEDDRDDDDEQNERGHGVLPAGELGRDESGEGLAERLGDGGGVAVETDDRMLLVDEHFDARARP